MAWELPEGFSGFGTTPFKGEGPGRSGEARVRFPPKNGTNRGKAVAWRNCKVDEFSYSASISACHLGNEFRDPILCWGFGVFTLRKSKTKVRFGKTWKHHFRRDWWVFFFLIEKRCGVFFQAFLLEVRRVINGRRLCTFLGQHPGKTRLEWAYQTHHKPRDQKHQIVLPMEFEPYFAANMFVSTIWVTRNSGICKGNFQKCPLILISNLLPPERSISRSLLPFWIPPPTKCEPRSHIWMFWSITLWILWFGFWYSKQRIPPKQTQNQ